MSRVDSTLVISGINLEAAQNHAEVVGEFMPYGKESGVQELAAYRVPAGRQLSHCACRFEHGHIRAEQLQQRMQQSACNGLLRNGSPARNGSCTMYMLYCTLNYGCYIILLRPALTYSDT